MPRVGAPVAERVMRRLPRPIDVELFEGIHVPLDLTQPLQSAAFWTGERSERPTASVVRQWVRGASRFFDVGANFGFYSYLALRADPAVQVHAFEPMPALHALHVAVRDRNGLERLDAVPYGLADEAAQLELRVVSDELGHSTFGDHPDHRADDPEPTVSVLPFDTWRVGAGVALPDDRSWVAKIDVEGYEERALRGMAQSLEAQAFRGLVVELNDYTLELCGSSVEAVLQVLASYGYVPDASVPRHDGMNAFFVPQT